MFIRVKKKKSNINQIVLPESKKTAASDRASIVVKNPSPDNSTTQLLNRAKVEPIRRTPSVKKTVEEVNKLTRTPVGIPAQSATQEEVNTASESNNTYSDGSFTQSQLDAAWATFIVELKQDSAHSYSILSNQNPTLQTNGTVQVCLNSKMQLELFRQNVRDALIRFLKQQLGVSTVRIEEVVDGRQVETKAKFLTEAEKFKHLVEKYPNLNVLRNTFNLDFE